MFGDRVESGLQHEAYTALLRAFPDGLSRDQVGAAVSIELEEVVPLEALDRALTRLYFGDFVSRVPGDPEQDSRVIFRARAV